MGMFDTVHFSCPKCNKINSIQSKAGDCMLDNYTLINAPLSILASLVEETKEYPVYCEQCNSKLAFNIIHIPEVQIKLV